MVFPHLSSSRIPFVTAALVLLTLVVILTTFILPYHNEQEASGLRAMESKIDDTTAHFQTLTEVYIQTLYGARGFMTSSDKVTRAEWRRFYENIGTAKRLPGLAVLGYVRRVPQDQQDAYLSDMRLDTTLQSQGYPDFSIKPPSDKLEMYPVTFVEPLSAAIIQNTLGFDYTSEPIRWAAVQKARDLNQPVLTAPIRTLDTNQAAFLLILPVYNPFLPRTNIVERQTAIIGFMTLGFRTSEFFNQAFPNLAADTLTLEVYDGDVLDASNLIFNTANTDQVLGVNTASTSVKTHTSIRHVLVADRTWTLVYHYPTPNEPTFLIPSLAGRLAVLFFTNIMTALVVYHWLEIRRDHKK